MTGAYDLHARVTPAQLEHQVDELISARNAHLVDRPIREIVELIDHVAGRFLDVRDPLRRTAEQQLPAITGYSEPMIRTVLDRMAADWRAGELENLLKSQFNEPSVLDGFRRVGRWATFAMGPDLITHIFSGNVPGVAITSLIRALLVKSASLGKSAAGEPLMPALFAHAVSEADPEVGRCIAVTYWPGGDERLEKVALGRAAAVIVYGGSEAIHSLRRRTPAGTPFIGYGHKLSFAVIGRESLEKARAAECARLLARDIALFDQQGCVSPHLVYVEEGAEITPAAWAELLARAMAELEEELPRGVLSPGEATAIRQLRGEAEFAQLSGRGDRLYESADGTAWTIWFETDPTFAPSCLNRVVRVKPIAQLDVVPQYLNEVSGLLQTVGLAGGGDSVERLGKALARMGVSRICPLGEMAWPPPTWHHDGRSPLLDLVRWCDREA